MTYAIEMTQMAWQKHIKFHDDRFRHSSNIKGIISTACEAVVLVLLMGGISYVALEMGSGGIIYITKFHEYWYMMCSSSVSRICLRNLKGCNVGITDGRSLWWTPWKLSQMVWYTYQVSRRLLHAFKQYKSVTTAVWEDVMLVLLMGGSCDWNWLRW
jgi:hypothetical protein